MQAQRWFAQHAASGQIGQTLAGITVLAKLPHYTNFRAAVAYATLNGCRVLYHSLRSSRRWLRCQKRWLISIDYGRTEPSALEFLADLPVAEVRIPDGARIVARRGFLPTRPFHPKVYVVDDGTDQPNLAVGIFLGSGNLTSSGLLTGTESGALRYWAEPNRTETSQMVSAHDAMSWFEDAWATANTIEAVLPQYRRSWTRPRRTSEEEDEQTTDLFLGGDDREVAGDDALDLTSAKRLWVEVRELYKNRGQFEPGNQLDLKRGSRVFFGFTPRRVPRNTIFGHVMLQNSGFPAIECSVRFGNNLMDKVNLPIPGVDGPASYDDSILMFERDGIAANGLPIFRIHLGNDRQLNRWIRGATSHVEMRMQGGRRFGLLS